MMKLALALVTVLAIFGLGQAYKIPDFGKGPLHKHIQDILDLISMKDSHSKTLEEEIGDFMNLLPGEECFNIALKYMDEDEKMQNALGYLFTPEFHDLLRSIEALKEHQACVMFIQNCGLDIVGLFQLLHSFIGMEEYVPPKIESLLTHKPGLQKVGDGMKGMLEELTAILPLDKIDALYEEKMKTSKVYAEFITKILSPEMQEIVTNLYKNSIYKNFLAKTNEKGLELVEFSRFSSRIIGIKW